MYSIPRPPDAIDAICYTEHPSTHPGLEAGATFDRE